MALDGYKILLPLPKTPYDVVIIGSGPAGTAAAQSLEEFHPDWGVAIVERGPIQMLSHAWNLESAGLRRPLYYSHATQSWICDNEFFQNAIPVPVFGGRSVYW